MNCYFLRDLLRFVTFYVLFFPIYVQCVCIGTKSLTLSSPLLERESKGGRKEGKQGYFEGLDKTSYDYMSHVRKTQVLVREYGCYSM